MRKNFCAAPWAGLSVDPDGLAKACCISEQRIPLDKISQARTHKAFVEIRQHFIDDQQHTNCRQCWEREKINSDWESRRSIYQYDYFNDLDDPHQFRLEHLDLRWSNTCNLNCVYCSSTFSSKWAELQGKKQRYRVALQISDQDLSNLKVLQLAGGEPMLIKENLDILSRLSSLNPSVDIEVTTNLTQIQNNAVYKMLKNFDNVSFVVSFESTGSKFEYIRNQAIWSSFRKNLEILAMDFMDIQFNMVYFPLSSLDINNAFEVALEYTMPQNIFVVSQSGGHGFDMLSQRALQYIKQLNLDQATHLPTILKQRFLEQIQTIQTQQTETFLPQYEKFDQLTNQNHKLLFKELYQ
jgi:organic radical activating enzyme